MVGATVRMMARAYCSSGVCLGVRNLLLVADGAEQNVRHCACFLKNAGCCNPLLDKINCVTCSQCSMPKDAT